MFDLADDLEPVSTVVRMAKDHDVQYPAATMAYYPFVSLLPLLVLLLAATGERLARRVQATTPRVLTPEARQLVYESMTSASGRTGATLFAIVVLVWAGANVVAGFRTIVERVEGRTERSALERVRDGIGVVGSIGLALVSTVVTSVTFALLPVGPLVVVGGLVALLVALAVSFLPLYYVPSRSVTSVSAAAPGALTAAFGWTVLLAAIHFYAVNAARYAMYGVLSGVLLVLTGFYAGAMVLLVGVLVNAALLDTGEARDAKRARDAGQ